MRVFRVWWFWCLVAMAAVLVLAVVGTRVRSDAMGQRYAAQTSAVPASG